MKQEANHNMFYSLLGYIWSGIFFISNVVQEAKNSWKLIILPVLLY